MSEPSAPSEGPFPQIRQRVQEWLESDTPATQVERDRFTLLERVDRLTREVQEQPTTVHVATPEGIAPCGLGTHDVTTAALIAEVSCVECLRAIAVEKGEKVVELSRELRQALTPQLPLRISHLPDRVAQLERDMASAEQRLAAMEIAARESAQSGGADHVEVAGGGSPEPCPVTAYNDAVCIRMVCAYDLGHISAHYNPASGGWTWDDDGNVTAQDQADLT